MNSRIQAPIDNKNIMEWFTDNFHDGDYIETHLNKVTYQVFYFEGCLCELKYRFGQNWFMFRIIEGNSEDVARCNKQVERIIEGMNDSDSDEVIYNPLTGVYEFWFINE